MSDNDLNFFFPELAGPGAAPVPPEEVRIKEMNAEPYPDGSKVRINIEVSPFQKRPWMEVVMLNSQGDEVATASFIEPMNWKLEFVLHIRRTKPQGNYKIIARLFYPEMPENDRREVAFSIE